MFQNEDAILQQLRGSSSAIKPKGVTIPEFFIEPVHLEFRSKTEGRPIWEEREFVRIRIPGDRNSSPVEPVNDGHKERWPEAYAAFKAGQEAPLEGVPLKEWPQINTARIKELAYFNIHTVEHLAAVTDNNLQNLGMGARELRDRAKLFLEVAAKGTGPLERLISRNEALVAQNEWLTRELEAATLRAAAAEQKEQARGA